MNNQIKLATLQQALLFELELSGQISDGYWENARPRDHYKQVCAAEVLVDPAQQGLNFHPARKYNFAAADLIEYVGARMRLYILAARKYPSLSKASIRHLDSGEWIWKIQVGEEVPAWQQRFHEEMSQVCGVHNYAEMKMMVADLDPSQYTVKDLRKDLKAINEAFKHQF